jgi:hypothetical protein
LFPQLVVVMAVARMTVVLMMAVLPVVSVVLGSAVRRRQWNSPRR